MKEDDVIVIFCNAKTAEIIGAPRDAVVITELLNDDAVVAVKRDEFIGWLLEQDEELE